MLLTHALEELLLTPFTSLDLRDFEERAFGQIQEIAERKKKFLPHLEFLTIVCNISKPNSRCYMVPSPKFTGFNVLVKENLKLEYEAADFYLDIHASDIRTTRIIATVLRASIHTCN